MTRSASLTWCSVAKGRFPGWVVLEPDRLAVVGALTGTLEVQPLETEVLAGPHWVKLMEWPFVLLPDRVMVVGTGFPKGDADV